MELGQPDDAVMECLMTQLWSASLMTQLWSSASLMAQKSTKFDHSLDELELKYTL